VTNQMIGGCMGREGFPLEFYRALDEYDNSAATCNSLSSALTLIVEEKIKEEGWDEDTRFGITNVTAIWFSDGQLAKYWAEEDALWNLVSEIESGAVGNTIKIDAAGGDFESFYPRERIAMVAMPLLHVMDAAKNEIKELNTDLTARGEPRRSTYLQQSQTCTSEIEMTDV